MQSISTTSYDVDGIPSSMDAMFVANLNWENDGVKNQKALMYDNKGQKNYLYHYDVNLQ